MNVREISPMPDIGFPPYVVSSQTQESQNRSMVSSVRDSSRSRSRRHFQIADTKQPLSRPLLIAAIFRRPRQPFVAIILVHQNNLVVVSSPWFSSPWAATNPNPLPRYLM